MPFKEPDVLVRTLDGRHIWVAEPMTFVTRSGETIVVPIGTTADGASIPQPLWIKLPPFGLYWRASILHDFLYRRTERPREECDALLLEAMESDGVPLETRMVIYEGVRAGGAGAFAADRRRLTTAQAHRDA